MEQIFKLSKLKGATVATVTAAMVDKSPKFLKSTPTFPRELKMGIFGGSENGKFWKGVKLGNFGGSETGKFWKGANCDNSDRREGGEGVTLQLGAGNALIYCHWYVAMN